MQFEAVNVLRFPGPTAPAGTPITITLTFLPDAPAAGEVTVEAPAGTTLADAAPAPDGRMRRVFVGAAGPAHYRVTVSAVITGEVVIALGEE